MKIGEYFLKQGIISGDELKEVLDLQAKNQNLLGEILIERGLVTEDQIAKVLADQNNLPFISLDDRTIDETTKKIFPLKTMKEMTFFPLQVEGDILTVAVSNPFDIRILKEIRQFSGCQVRLVVATKTDIESCIQKNFESIDSVSADILDAVTMDSQTDLVETMNMHSLETAVKGAPVVRLVNSIISQAIKRKASDIHLEPQSQNLRVRFRIDGVLHEFFTIPKNLQLQLISRIKIISGMDIAEMRRPQDGRITFTDQGKSYDIRASSLPDSYGEKIVLRVLDKQDMILSFESLGIDEKEADLLRRLIRIPYGIILITGPTGSGKTTTLYTILNQLNEKTRNIVTVENPVEYQIDGINQTEVNERAGYHFATGLRHILRQDPDVIMIGEIRDLETAEIAIQAALTGHLVLSTLHTNNAAVTVARLIDMDVEPFLIGTAVCGIVAQRLIRKLCPHCCQPEQISLEMQDIIKQHLDDLTGCRFAKPVGCELCQGIGYKGRTAILEIMTISPEIKELIIRRATEREIEQMALEQGMKTLQAKALQKACRAETSLEEAMRVTFIKTF